MLTYTAVIPTITNTITIISIIMKIIITLTTTRTIMMFDDDSRIREILCFLLLHENIFT